VVRHSVPTPHGETEVLLDAVTDTYSREEKQEITALRRALRLTNRPEWVNAYTPANFRLAYWRRKIWEWRLSRSGLTIYGGHF
jgi:hypothetical protein